MTALPRTATLIVNARSRRGQKLFASAKAKLEAAGLTLDAAHALHDPADLETTARLAVAGGTKMLIVGGGDGSLSSSVDFLVGHDCVFALLPLGTANSFARTLGIPLDLDGAIDVIANGRRCPIDLGMIDNDYFANSAAMGLSPLVAETVPHWLKAWFGKAGYGAWALISLVRFRPFVVSIDGERFEATELRIANGGFHGGTELVEAADVQSGEIVVQAVLGRTRRGLLWSWLSSLLKLPRRHQTVRNFHGRSLRIETDSPLPISIDGEIAAHTPVTAHVAASVIDMAVPIPPRSGEVAREA